MEIDQKEIQDSIIDRDLDLSGIDSFADNEWFF